MIQWRRSRRSLAGLLAGLIGVIGATYGLFTGLEVWAKSPLTADNVLTYNMETPFTFRASGAVTVTTVTAETAVAGFGGLCEVVVFLNVTVVSFVGGTTPTAQVKVWLQRSPDGGTTWDDVLALQTDSLAAAATEQNVGYYSCRLGTPAAPAAVQDAGGTPPFAQRVGGISDSLRIKRSIVTTGAPTSFSVTFGVTGRGRP